MPEELKKVEMSWIKNAQEELKSRMKKGEFKTMIPFIDDKGIIRVGGRIDKAIVSHEEKHPVLLPNEHRIPVNHTQCAQPWAFRSSHNDCKSQTKILDPKSEQAQ